MRSACNAIVSILAISLANAGAHGQVRAPKPPETYDIQVRYRINADRNDRVLQFEAMTKYFASIGFTERPGEDNDLAAFDPKAERMIGTAPSADARKLLGDGRVQTLLLMPAGVKLPDDPQAMMRVQIELSRNRDQLGLFNQTQLALRQLGFRIDVGFDPLGYTVIRGTVPAISIPLLVKDLRYQPGGWLLPETPSELYVHLPDGTRTPSLVRPFADQVPVRVAEVLGPAEAIPMIVALPPIPADQPHLVKWTADLRRRLAEEGAREKPIRLEVVLAVAPGDSDFEWRDTFHKAGATIEGRVGPIITVSVPAGSKAADLAALADVVSVRLPRLAAADAKPSAKPAEPKAAEPKDAKEELIIQKAPALPAASPDEDPLKMTRLDRLHSLGFKGQGVRVVIIDTDFAGWDRYLVKGKGPKSKVSFLDLTAERSLDVRPEPMPGEMGHGTYCALTVRHAAPEAELQLVRIPADAPYQLVNVGRSIRGDDFRTEGLIARRTELGNEFDALKVKRGLAKDEYNRAFADFDPTPIPEKRRRDAQAALEKLDDQDKAALEKMERINALELGLMKLKGAHVVLGLLSWNTGFALNGASSTSSFLDEWLVRPKGATYTRHLTKVNPSLPPVWLQPAGDTRGQAWTGPFFDVDNNGVMEFAGPSDLLKPGRWSRELNFISNRVGDKEQFDLVAGSKLRVSVQWWEPHDRTLSEIEYRVPVVPLKLQLVRQRDPKGEKFSSDELDLIAESEGQPERLQVEPHFGVYEHSLEITLPADGRYAVRLEARVPKRIRPASVPTLETQEVRWDLRPRLFVASADGTADMTLGDFAAADAGVAVPADARGVVAVGAADRTGKPMPYSASGAGPNALLAIKPDLLAPATMPAFGDDGPAATGTALSASFAAGLAASLRSSGFPASGFPSLLRLPPGSPVIVPDALLVPRR